MIFTLVNFLILSLLDDFFTSHWIIKWWFLERRPESTLASLKKSINFSSYALSAYSSVSMALQLSPKAISWIFLRKMFFFSCEVFIEKNWINSWIALRKNRKAGKIKLMTCSIIFQKKNSYSMLRKKFIDGLKMCLVCHDLCLFND